MKSLFLLAALALVSCKSEQSPAETVKEVTPTPAVKATPPPTIPPNSDPPPPPGPKGILPEMDPQANQAKSPLPAPDPDIPKPPINLGKYKVGKPAPGKPGFTISPYTDKPVDTRGIPPGALVRDPNDPHPDHKFRTPQPQD